MQTPKDSPLLKKVYEENDRLRSLLGECLEWFEMNGHGDNCTSLIKPSYLHSCNCEAPELRAKIENELKKEG